MRLPSFDYLAPTSLAEASALLETHGAGAALLAGGTDLIPRLRQRLAKPDILVSLKNLVQLRSVELVGSTLYLGAGATLRTVMDHAVVSRELSGLHEALAGIGAWGIQHFTGTIGGNLLLETRCWHYNQSAWWRSGRERCFKNGGQACLANDQSKECTSLCQSDGAVMLTALSAQAVIRFSSEERLVPVADLFSGRGEAPFTLKPGEILQGLRIMLPAPGTGQSYQKLRWRSAVDFPLASAGAVVGMSKGRVDRVRLVIGAAGPKPVVVAGLDQMLRGRKPEPDILNEAAAVARKQVEGLVVENTIGPAEYRRKMIQVMARRALAAAAGRAAQG